MIKNAYTTKLHALLSPAERATLQKLSSPQKIQDFLDHFPVFYPTKGESNIKSPRHALTCKKMHCMEGAILAAAALAYHGEPPLLMDLTSAPYDYDHVVALFKQNGHWGAISKTNHYVLRWRDPIFKTPRELALSYFHEYFWPDKDRHYGHKTMYGYSKPFDLRRHPPEKLFEVGDLDWLAEELDQSPHFPIIPKNIRGNLRKASPIELKAHKLVEWKKDKK